MIPPAGDDFARARALVLRYGWNSTSYQILNPGIAHWFAPAGDAVVGYVDCGAVWTAAGAPVCAEARLPSAVAEFEAAAAALGASVCYLAAEARLENLCRARPGYAFAVLGAQPCWDPAGWPRILARRASLRAQLARARNKGVVVRTWSSARATDHPDLHRCLAEWLASKGLPALRFMTTPFTLGRLADRMVFVAERGDAVVGFLVATPVPARGGWLVEQIVRGRSAPNGTAELMVDAAFSAMVSGGATYVTLGLAPLSRHAGDPLVSPWWLRGVLAWVRAHGRRFYNFDGLDTFKGKFEPERWEPVYAVVNEPSFRPRILLAVAQAFSDNAPVRMVAGALVRAVRQELAWMVGPGRPRASQSTTASGRT